MRSRRNLAGCCCSKSFHELLHLVNLPCRSETRWQLIHRFELLELEICMLTSGSTQCISEHGEGSMKLTFISSNKLLDLLLVENKVELRDRANTEGLSNLLILSSLNSTEHNIFILICTSLCFINRLESHAGWATRWPEVNNDSTEIGNYSFKLSHSRDLHNFTKLGPCRSLLRSPASQIFLNLSTHGWVLHRLRSHTLHAWWDQTRWDSSGKTTLTATTLSRSTSVSLERQRIALLVTILSWCRAIICVEQWVGVLHQIILLLLHHWRDLLAHGRI